MSNKRPPEGHVERRSMTCYCSFRIRGDQTLSPQGPKVKFSGDRLSRSNSRLCVCTVNGLYYSFEYRMPDEGLTGWRLKQCISLRRPPLPAQPDNMAPWTLDHAVCQGIDASAHQICLRALKSQSHWTFFFFNFPFSILTFCGNSLHSSRIKTEWQPKFLRSASIIYFFLFFYLDFHNNGITYEKMGIVEMFFCFSLSWNIMFIWSLKIHPVSPIELIRQWIWCSGQHCRLTARRLQWTNDR